MPGKSSPKPLIVPVRFERPETVACTPAEVRQIGKILAEILAAGGKQRRQADGPRFSGDQPGQHVGFASPVMGGDQAQDEPRGAGKLNGAAGAGRSPRRRRPVRHGGNRAAGTLGEVEKGRAAGGGWWDRRRGIDRAAWGKDGRGIRLIEWLFGARHESLGEIGARDELRHAATPKMSGRSSSRGMPVNSSILVTRSIGTCRHIDIADGEMSR